MVFHRVPFGKTPQAESSGTACRPIAEARKFLQLVEGEHGFLGAVVVELLVLELEVFELGTEHEAGSEAGHLGVTNLGDQRHGTEHSPFGRSRTYMCGRAIFYGLPGSLRSRPTS